MSQESAFLRRLELVKSNVKKRIKRQVIRVKMRMGLGVALQTTDRHVLEKTIFPYFAARSDCRRILFVGCEWYTKHYEKIFVNQEYWTIEIDPQLKEYGAKNHVCRLTLYMSS